MIGHQKKWGVFGLAVVSCLGIHGVEAEARGLDLTGTVWERVSAAAQCKPDPLLLYSLALQESSHSVAKGLVSPHPYALRNSPSGSSYPRSFEDAKAILGRYIAEDRLTDIGIMQINYRWNGHRVKSPHELLHIETNIRVAADILCDSIKANPSDLLRSIGGYHTLNPRRDAQAKAYAQSVLNIWRSLKRLNTGTT